MLSYCKACGHVAKHVKNWMLKASLKASQQVCNESNKFHEFESTLVHFRQFLQCALGSHHVSNGHLLLAKARANQYGQDGTLQLYNPILLQHFIDRRLFGISCFVLPAYMLSRDRICKRFAEICLSHARYASTAGQRKGGKIPVVLKTVSHYVITSQIAI